MRILKITLLSFIVLARGALADSSLGTNGLNATPENALAASAISASTEAGAIGISSSVENANSIGQESSLSTSSSLSTTALVFGSSAQSVTGSTLSISGTKNSQIQYTDVEGPNSVNYTNGLTRRETTDLKISGQLYDEVKVLGSIQQSDDLLEDKFSLELATRNLDLLLGDFQGSIPDSDFGLSNQAISGARFTGEFSNFGWMAFGAAPRGNTRYDRFYGNATQGPYTLSYSPVAAETEQVSLDKVRLTKGVDYDIDYLAGQITFRKQAIAPNSLIEVVYTSRDTLYDRYLYGLELHLKPMAGEVLRAYYLSSADDPSTASSIYAAQTVSGTATPQLPIDLQIIGTTASIAGRRGNLDLEYDYSNYDQDILTGDYVSGEAGKVSGSLIVGPLKATGKYRRTSSDYMSLGDADIGQDLLNYGGGLDYKGDLPLYLSGGYEYTQHTLASGPLNTQTTTGLATFTPKEWPDLKYNITHNYEDDGTSDTTQASIVKDSLMNHGEIAKQYAYVQLSGQFEDDSQSGMSPEPLSIPSSTLNSHSQMYEVGAALKGVKWLSGDLSAIYRDTSQLDPIFPENDSDSNAQTYQANLNSAINNIFLLSTQDKYIVDSILGNNSTLDNKIKFKPYKWINLEGNYKLDNLQMLIVGVNEPVATTTLSGKIDLSPVQTLNIICDDSDQSTELQNSGTITNSQGNDQITCKWAALPSVSLEAGYLENAFSLLNTSVANLSLQSQQDTETENYGLHFAPKPYFGIDLAYVYGWNLKSNSDPVTSNLDTAEGTNEKTTLGLHSALSERLRYKGDYSLQINEQIGNVAGNLTFTPAALGSIDQQSNLINQQTFYGTVGSRTQTIDQGIDCELGKLFVAGISGNYNDYLDQMGDVTTLGAGADIKFMSNPLQVDLAYNFANSMGAAQTNQQSLTGNITGKSFSFLSFQAKGEFTRTDMPYSAATQMSMNVSEKF